MRGNIRMQTFSQTMKWWPDMPTRMLREGILTSERVASLNWGEEVFYRRLMSVVDDFGRYYATPMLLRAACYPLQLNKVSDSDIEKWIAGCATAALVRVYPAKDGKRYIELMDFRQRVRASVSKFPPPPDSCQTHDGHMPDNCPSSARLDVDVDEDDITHRKRRSVFAKPDDVDQLAWDSWLAVRKGKRAVAVSDLVISAMRREAGKAGISLNDAIVKCVERNWIAFESAWVTPAQIAKPAKSGGYAEVL